MRDSIDLGPAPSEEDCAQVGREDYPERACRECHAYLHQLRRQFGDEPEGASLSVKSNPHDFGNYLSVVCFYDPDQTASVDYALRCEGHGPREWDDEARQELAGKTRPRSA